MTFLGIKFQVNMGIDICFLMISNSIFFFNIIIYRVRMFYSWDDHSQDCFSFTGTFA